MVQVGVQHLPQAQFESMVVILFPPRAEQGGLDIRWIFQNLTWNQNGQHVGLCKFDSANCACTIREKTTWFPGGALGCGHRMC